MRLVATNVARSMVCMPVCVRQTGEPCEPIGLTLVDPRNHVLDRGPDPPTEKGTFDEGHVTAYCNVSLHCAQFACRHR